jgi:hypothetical protein
VAMAGGDPDWATLRRLAEGGGLSSEGKAAVVWALANLERLLGPSWPGRQFRLYGRLPGELLMFASYQYVLPQFLSLVMRLRSAAGESTFDPVLAGLRRGLDSAGWRHLLLQMEVARAARTFDSAASFEPKVPGTDRKADVSLEPTDGKVELVETTTLFRSEVDRQWEEYEDRLRRSLMEIERRHGVYSITHLTDHLDSAATEDWLLAVNVAAADASASGQQQKVRSAAGEILLCTTGFARRTATFTGAALTADGWRRLGRAVQGKARQSAGLVPAWLRIDAMDGFFQFTDWAQLTGPQRTDRLADALANALVDATHLQGVILSSGLAVSLGATDPTIEDTTNTTSRGTALRRTVSPHLVRESALVPLHGAAAGMAANWASAYSTEPSWLDEDLTLHGLSPLADLWH